MLKITIPNNNIAERKYILDIIFDEFLGLDFKVLESDDCQDWEIELENGSKIIFEDHFFNKYLKELEYLKLENIPAKVEFVKNQFIVEDDIPIIYGNKKLETKNDELKTIICGIDIFASCFFNHFNRRRLRLRAAATTISGCRFDGRLFPAIRGLRRRWQRQLRLPEMQ